MHHVVRDAVMSAVPIIHKAKRGNGFGAVPAAVWRGRHAAIDVVTGDDRAVCV